MVEAKEFQIAIENCSVAIGFYGVVSRQSFGQDQRVSCRDKIFCVATELARPGVFCRDIMFFCRDIMFLCRDRVDNGGEALCHDRVWPNREVFCCDKAIQCCNIVGQVGKISVTTKYFYVTTKLAKARRNYVTIELARVRRIFVAIEDFYVALGAGRQRSGRAPDKAWALNNRALGALMTRPKRLQDKDVRAIEKFCHDRDFFCSNKLVQ